MVTVPHRFSLIVSCHNFESYVGECLASIQRQDYDPSFFEVLCVDDGSTDGSARIIEDYQRQFSNFVSIRTQNQGLERACNLAIRKAKHHRMMRIDADDKIAPNLLSQMNRSIRENPDFDFYYCKNYLEYYSEDEQYPKELPEFDPEEIFARGDFFATGTVYKRSDLEEIGFFSDEVKNCGLENYTVILKLISRQKRGFAVGGTLFYYRRHQTNMSRLKQEAIIDYGQKLLSFYGRPFRTNQYHPYGLKL